MQVTNPDREQLCLAGLTVRKGKRLGVIARSDCAILEF